MFRQCYAAETGGAGHEREEGPPIRAQAILSTGRPWDVSQAETYVMEIRSVIERVAPEPGRGRDCSDVREGYRRYAIGSHLLFYVETEYDVDVIRILHQRMDPTRHF